MSAHISDELPRLLSGEAKRDAVLDAAAHLRECADCQQELVSAVVAHASLTSAHRFAPEIVGRPTEVSAPVDTAPDALPDLSAVFAQVRTEADEPPPARHNRRSLHAVAAVAAGILIGGGATVLGTHLGEPGPAPSHTVALAAFDQGTVPAKAQIVDDHQLKVDASALPSLDSQHRYEVWLTNPGRNQMQPVGWVGSNGKADLTVPSSLLHSYTAIEVSVQPMNTSSYAYSHVSVLRGSYRS